MEWKQTRLCEAELASTPLSMGGGELVRVWRKADARSVFVGGCAVDVILRDGKFVIVGPEAP